MKAAHGKGHTLKHARRSVKHKHHTVKHHPVHHHKTATKHAHHVHAKAKHATHAKARGLALAPGDVACCAAEALAASLRLHGIRVSDEDVLALYWHTADDPDAGASILATLEAAWRFGLGGVRPRFGLLEDAADFLDHGAGEQGLTAIGAALGDRPGALEQLGLAGDDVTRLAPVHLGQQSARNLGAGGELRVEGGLIHGTSLILGLELPGPHTVLATPDGWWSWGELYCPCEFPDAVIEEAWAVSWA